MKLGYYTFIIIAVLFVRSFSKPSGRTVAVYGDRISSKSDAQTTKLISESTIKNTNNIPIVKLNDTQLESNESNTIGKTNETSSNHNSTDYEFDYEYLSYLYDTDYFDIINETLFETMKENSSLVANKEQLKDKPLSNSSGDKNKSRIIRRPSIRKVSRAFKSRLWPFRYTTITPTPDSTSELEQTVTDINESIKSTTVQPIISLEKSIKNDLLIPSTMSKPPVAKEDFINVVSKALQARRISPQINEQELVSFDKEKRKTITSKGSEKEFISSDNENKEEITSKRKEKEFFFSDNSTKKEVVSIRREQDLVYDKGKKEEVSSKIREQELTSSDKEKKEEVPYKRNEQEVVSTDKEKRKEITFIREEQKSVSSDTEIKKDIIDNISEHSLNTSDVEKTNTAMVNDIKKNGRMAIPFRHLRARPRKNTRKEIIPVRISTAFRRQRRRKLKANAKSIANTFSVVLQLNNTSPTSAKVLDAVNKSLEINESQKDKSSIVNKKEDTKAIAMEPKLSIENASSPTTEDDEPRKIVRNNKNINSTKQITPLLETVSNKSSLPLFELLVKGKTILLPINIRKDTDKPSMELLQETSKKIATLKTKSSLPVPNFASQLGANPHGTNPRGTSPFGRAPEGLSPFGSFPQGVLSAPTRNATSIKKSVNTTSPIDVKEERFHVQIKKPDGSINGNYVVLDHLTGDLNGVRYDAVDGADQELIQRALLSFLSLDPRLDPRPNR